MTWRHKEPGHQQLWYWPSYSKITQVTARSGNSHSSGLSWSMVPPETPLTFTFFDGAVSISNLDPEKWKWLILLFIRRVCFYHFSNKSIKENSLASGVRSVGIFLFTMKQVIHHLHWHSRITQRAWDIDWFYMETFLSDWHVPWLIDLNLETEYL